MCNKTGGESRPFLLTLAAVKACLKVDFANVVEHVVGAIWELLLGLRGRRDAGEHQYRGHAAFMPPTMSVSMRSPTITQFSGCWPSLRAASIIISEFGLPTM